jgi:hypothetical protein
MSPSVSFLGLIRQLITLQIAADLKPHSDAIVLRYTIVWKEALQRCGHETKRLWYVVERGALQREGISPAFHAGLHHSHRRVRIAADAVIPWGTSTSGFMDYARSAPGR